MAAEALTIRRVERASGRGVAAVVALALIAPLPQGDRARPWIWAGHGAAMGYVLLAMIARWATLACLCDRWPGGYRIPPAIGTLMQVM